MAQERFAEAEAEQEEQRRPAASEEVEGGERANVQRAQVISRSLATEQFGSGSPAVQAKAAPAGTGLTAAQVQRAMRRNPHWASSLGIRPSNFKTSAGPRTAEFAHAVAAYQQSSGLAVDGIAGPKTHHSVMSGMLEGGSTKEKEIPGVLGDADVRAARRAMAQKNAAGKSKDVLEPGVLSEKDVLEPGVLGAKDTLEPGVLGDKDVMESGVLGESDSKDKGGAAKPAAKNPDVMESGVLGAADQMEPGVLGEKDVMESGVLGEAAAPRKLADELE